MSARAKFINYQYFIDNHPMFNGNIEQNTIDATILKAQIQYFRSEGSPIGTNLYNAIQTQIINSGAPQGNYATLVNDYIAPALVDWVAVKCVAFMSTRFTNKGPVEARSDYSNPISLEKLQMLQDEFRESARSLTQACADYVLQNQSLFPELYTNNGIDEKNPKDSGFQQIIYNPRKARFQRPDAPGCCGNDFFR